MVRRFKLAVSKTVLAIQKAMNECNLDINDISYLVCHQANNEFLIKYKSIKFT